MRSSSFPPGYRFRPTDVELLVYYLKRKVMGKKLHFNIISEVDIYKYEPSDLPDKSCLHHGDLKWYFFCPRGRKYGTGERTNRATDKGYWKTTGRDRPVQYRDKVVGIIKTLVYHTGRAPRGDRTDWVMHEYRLQDRDLANPGALDAFVLCVIFHKDGPGPRNGAQYGAPFKEEEWTDDEEGNCLSSIPSANLCAPTFINTVNSIASTSNDSLSLCGGSSSEVYSFETAPSAYKALSPVPENDAMMANDLDVQLHQCSADDVNTMLARFVEEDNTILNEVTTENIDERNCQGTAEAGTYPDENDIYNDLGDIELNDVYNLHNGYAAGYAFNEMLPSDNVSFLELDDLDTPLFPVEVVSTGSRGADGIYTDLGNFIYEKSCDTVDTSNGSLNLPSINYSSPLQPARPPGSASSQNDDAV